MFNIYIFEKTINVSIGSDNLMNLGKKKVIFFA